VGGRPKGADWGIFPGCNQEFFHRPGIFGWKFLRQGALAADLPSTRFLRCFRGLGRAQPPLGSPPAEGGVAHFFGLPSVVVGRLEQILAVVRKGGNGIGRGGIRLSLQSVWKNENPGLKNNLGGGPIRGFGAIFKNWKFLLAIGGEGPFEGNFAFGAF